MDIVQESLNEIKEHKKKVSQGMEHYDNIADITTRFLEAMHKDPTKFKEYYPLWAEQMEITMKWFTANKVTDKYIFEVFNIVHKTFSTLGDK